MSALVALGETSATNHDLVIAVAAAISKARSVRGDLPCVLSTKLLDRVYKDAVAALEPWMSFGGERSSSKADLPCDTPAKP